MAAATTLRHVQLLLMLQLLLLMLLPATEVITSFPTDLRKIGQLSGDERDANQVCFGRLGCFRRDGRFFHIRHRPISKLPQGPEVINMKYLLYTRQNPDKPQVLNFTDRNSVRKSNFNVKMPNKVLLFGYTEYPERQWVRNMRKTLLRYCSCNILVPDWSDGAGEPYWQAVANARVAGVLIAEMLQWLDTEFGASLDRVHLLGHSLGGQLAGYVGEALKGRVGRITGLDPAGPYFEWLHPTVRLDHTDAKFVDVIHTDGNNSWSVVTGKGGLGLMQPSGHVDFYPNGGRAQPNCPDETIEGGWCDHQRVNPLYEATMNFSWRRYRAVPCDSYADFKAGKCSCGVIGCASLGIKADQWRKAGRFNVKMYLDTTGKSPYEVPL